MKTLIVPVDFSEDSLNGLSYALELARKFESAVEMVYVQHEQPDFAHVGLDVERRKATEAFEKIIESYKDNLGKGVSLSYIIKKGKVYNEVIQQARAWEDAAIVTSTHGASGFEEIFIGSNTLRMLAGSDVPIFTVRHGVKGTPLKNIVFPLDTTNESRQKAPYVAFLAKAYDATVHVLGILESPNDETRQKLAKYIEQMENYFSQHEIKFKSVELNNMDVVDGTLAYTAKLEDALISISSKNRRTLPIFMVGGKAQRLLSRADAPVLCLAPTVQPIRGSFKTFGSF